MCLCEFSERESIKRSAPLHEFCALSLCFLSFARCARERNHERERNAFLSEREMFRCKEQTLRFDVMHQFEIVLKFTETKVFVF